MRENYVTVKCPRCNSTSEIKSNGVVLNILLCPVCCEGEIEYQVEQRRIHRVASDLPAKSKELVYRF